MGGHPRYYLIMADGGAAPLLLLSMPQMADPNFARTVVLLCDYTGKGAWGLVVNRQMAEPAWTVVKTEPPVRVDPDLKLWIGGPVDPQHTCVLMAEAQGPGDEQREVAPGVLLSDSHELTLRLLQAPPSSRARVVVGYAGWGPGQLDREIAASAWLVTEVDSKLIFGVPSAQMWETAIRRLGTDPSALQTSPGVH
jgi:putative transcriptional regulator